jgi:endonuclease G
VTVPARCLKVLVVLLVGSNDAGRISSSTRVITVDTPNDNLLGLSWGGYCTSVY